MVLAWVDDGRHLSTQARELEIDSRVSLPSKRACV